MGKRKTHSRKGTRSVAITPKKRRRKGRSIRSGKFRMGK